MEDLRRDGVVWYRELFWRKTCIFHNSGDQRYKIKVSAWLGSGEDPLPS